MKTAIVAGASGLIGSYLLDILLESGQYDQVKALVRQKLNKEHPLLKQVIVDYEDLQPEAVKGDHVYCCLGTTIKKAGSRAAFRKVDYEYPMHLARATHKNGAQQCALVSAMGANMKSLFFYNRVKGKLEVDLKTIPFDTLCIFRPSMLLGPRNEFRFGEEAGKKIMQGLRFLLPSNTKAIHASQVAAAMVDQMNRHELGTHIIPSGRMQKYPKKE
jgi:uncharacterized protein YbjT (DUF2867 family)